jgi:hypothetical protein
VVIGVVIEICIKYPKGELELCSLIYNYIYIYIYIYIFIYLVLSLCTV